MKRNALPLVVILPLLSILAQAQPPGPRGGGGGRGPGGGGGPLPIEARETIMGLFAGHESIDRKVTMTEKGYTAVTTSKDPKMVAKLQEHVAAMEKRLDAGFPVRRWDPAFEEFFEHYDQLNTTIRKIENGVEIEVTGKTPEAVKVAQNHASIISGFVEKGDIEHHAEHPAALKPAAATESDPAKAGATCEHCKEACKCGAAGKAAPGLEPK